MDGPTLILDECPGLQKMTDKISDSNQIFTSNNFF